MFPPGNQGHWSGGGTQRLVLERGWECVNGSFQLRPVEKNLWTYVTLWTNVVFLFFT